MIEMFQALALDALLLEMERQVGLIDGVPTAEQDRIEKFFA